MQTVIRNILDSAPSVYSPEFKYLPTDGGISQQIADRFYTAIQQGQITERQVYDFLRSGELDSLPGMHGITSELIMERMNDGLDFSRFAADDLVEIYKREAAKQR